MELRVWVDSLQRTISGLTPETTCQEIIYALAHATRQKGRFVLVEQWRSSERSLAPTDHPLELLHKWGEHAKDVKFVLKHLDAPLATVASPSSSLLRPSSTATNEQVLLASAVHHGSGSTLNASVDLHDVSLTSVQSGFSMVSAGSRGRTSTPVDGQSTITKPRPRSAGAGARPPPPSYEHVIGQRSNTLGKPKTLPHVPHVVRPSEQLDRGAIRTDSPASLHSVDLSSNRYHWPANRAELEQMVESQQRTIDAQITRMQLVDNGQQQFAQNERHMAAEFDTINREISQLERQQMNLRGVLQAMRDWPMKQQLTTQESDYLQAEITKMKSKIENTTISLADQRKTEADLQRQIADIQRQLQTMEPAWNVEEDAELRGLRSETDSIEASIRQKKQRLDDLAAKVTESLPLQTSSPNSAVSECDNTAASKTPGVWV
uniref:Ras-associating domain-containing protein n=1 Tax=Plectus sambesii TaxID=2011161 RepID=A0A914WLF5_9BILA